MTTPPFNYDDWEDKIIAYVSGKMADADRQKFESQMAEMPELQEAVAFDALMKKQADNHFMTQYFNTNWDDIVKDIIPEEAETAKEREAEALNSEAQPLATSPKYPLSIKAILGGLGIVLLAFVGYFMYQNQVKPSKETRIENAMQTLFPPLPFDAEGTNLIDEAIDLYRVNKFEEAEVLFAQKDSTMRKNEDDAYGLYRAVNALMLRPPKTDIAYQILRNRYSFGGNSFKSNDVEWYLVLAYLQKKDYDNAKKILRNITNQTYEPNARKILNILEE